MTRITQMIRSFACPEMEILAYATSATVSQTISTVAGKDYSFTFYHTPRPGVNSTLSVSINSQVIATYLENGASLTNFNWVKFRTNFTATADTTTIGFSDVAATSAGTHIDNVVVTPLPLALSIRVSAVDVCALTPTCRDLNQFLRQRHKLLQTQLLPAFHRRDV